MLFLKKNKRINEKKRLEKTFNNGIQEKMLPQFFAALKNGKKTRLN